MNGEGVFNVFFTLAICVILTLANKLFRVFVQSKPEGRKTVLGRFTRVVVPIIEYGKRNDFGFEFFKSL